MHDAKDIVNVSGAKTKEQKRQREGVAKESGDAQKSPRKEGTEDSEEVTEVLSNQYELDKKIMEELEAKKKEAADTNEKIESLGPLADEDTDVDEEMSEKQEDYVADELDYDCTQDTDTFARKVGLSTQRIAEINKSVDDEFGEKENAIPVDINMGQRQKEAIGKEVRLEQLSEEELARAAALERIRKAKDKADVDEAMGRRSLRNKKT